METGMSKYESLAQFLKSRREDRVPMTFAEIERVTGTELPPSAHKHRPWWSNNGANSALTRVWLDAGFKSEQVDMAGQKLVFRRVGPQKTPPIVPGSRHPMFGALKGLLRIAEGTDVTKPADPEWGSR
jgi:hypothetical protein